MDADNLTGLIGYLKQDQWQSCFEEVLGEHLGPALEAADISFEDLGDILGQGVAMSLWGCAFEDFLGQEWDNENFVEVYLKRRGWKEGPRKSAYMRGLKEAVMSLYEVSQIVPGQSMMVRDLLRGGDPVLVHERSATQSLKPWGRIAARLVPEDGKMVLAGSLLAYSQQACEDLAENLRDILKRKRGQAEFPKIKTDVLRDLAPVFTLTWLFRTMENMVSASEPPVLFNGDGEDLVFHDVCFPLSKGSTQKSIAEVLNTIPCLQHAGRMIWNWTRQPGDHVPEGHSKAGDSKAQFLSTTLDDGGLVLGTLELKGRQLRLQVNSETRAEQGTAVLRNALGSLIGSPLTQIMTAEQALEEQRTSGRGEVLEDEIPLEEEAEVLVAVLEQHYRRVLEEVVPGLGHVTPRQAVKTAAGKKKVAAWLKQIEATTAGLGREGAEASFSFDWMWEELGIKGLRK